MYKRIILLALVALLSCDDDNSSINQGSVTETMKKGTWRVTSFIEDVNDETHYFTGYTFTFGASNVLTATKSANTYSGTWVVTNSSSSGTKFIINFSIPPAPSDFDELNDDWNVLTMTDSKIELKHVSGGDGSIDLLTFQKN